MRRAIGTSPVWVGKHRDPPLELRSLRNRTTPRTLADRTGPSRSEAACGQQLDEPRPSEPRATDRNRPQRSGGGATRPCADLARLGTRVYKRLTDLAALVDDRSATRGQGKGGEYLRIGVAAAAARGEGREVRDAWGCWRRPREGSKMREENGEWALSL